MDTVAAERAGGWRVGAVAFDRVQDALQGAAWTLHFIDVVLYKRKHEVAGMEFSIMLRLYCRIGVRINIPNRVGVPS
jgi:hypothetical protein